MLARERRLLVALQAAGSEASHRLAPRGSRGATPEEKRMRGSSTYAAASWTKPPMAWAATDAFFAACLQLSMGGGGGSF